MRVLGWLKSLPEFDYVPSRSAARWLIVAALLVWPIDIAVLKYGYRQSQPFTYTWNDVRYRTYPAPYWLDLSRLCLAVVAVALLSAFSPAAPRDMGVTLGKPKVTLFWIGFPTAVMVGIAIILLPGVCLLVRATAWTIPPDWLQPSYIVTPDVTWRVVWEACVVAPVGEEILYRGVPLLALERVCGRGWAVALGGVIWASLHFIYGYPIVLAQWYFLSSGAPFAWIFLKSRSVLTTVLFHAIWNLTGLVALDLVLLYQSDAVVRLLGQEKAPLPQEALVGEWACIKEESARGFTRFVVSQEGDAWSIEAWSDYGPDEKEDPMGKVTLSLLGWSRKAKALPYGFATWERKDYTLHIILRVEKDILGVAKDEVVVETFVIYKDKSFGPNHRGLSKYKKK